MNHDHGLRVWVRGSQFFDGILSADFKGNSESLSGIKLKVKQRHILKALSPLRQPRLIVLSFSVEDRRTFVGRVEIVSRSKDFLPESLPNCLVERSKLAIEIVESSFIVCLLRKWVFGIKDCCGDALNPDITIPTADLSWFSSCFACVALSSLFVCCLFSACFLCRFMFFYDSCVFCVIFCFVVFFCSYVCDCFLFFFILFLAVVVFFLFFVLWLLEQSPLNWWIIRN